MYRSKYHYLIGIKIQVTFLPQQMEFYFFFPHFLIISHFQRNFWAKGILFFSSRNHFSWVEKAVLYGPHSPQSEMFCIVLLSIILSGVIAYQFHRDCQATFMESMIYVTGMAFQCKASALNTVYRTRIYLNAMLAMITLNAVEK